MAPAPSWWAALTQPKTTTASGPKWTRHRASVGGTVATSSRPNRTAKATSGTPTEGDQSRGRATRVRARRPKQAARTLRGSTRSVRRPAAMVPATLKMPTRASRVEAEVAGMPWSWAAGVKWFQSRPLVEAPQTAKTPASSQNAGRRVAAARTRRARVTTWEAPPVPGACDDWACTAACSPRSSPRAHAATRPAAPASPHAAACHPYPSTTRDSTGRKTNCPTTPAAVSRPATRPRRPAPARSATLAASAVEAAPVPSPTPSPQAAATCAGEPASAVPAAPAPASTSAPTTTRRTPSRSISAAANGAVTPYSTMLIANATPIDARDQPRSSCSGTRSSPPKVVKAPVVTIAAPATATTVQPWAARPCSGS